MAGKRIPDLDPLSGAASANNDKLVIFDVDADTSKRIDRSQLAAGLVGDLPFTPTGFVSATTIPTAVTEIITDIAAAGGAGRVGNTPAGSISAATVQAAINELDAEKQPLNAGLTDIAGLAKTDSNFIVGNGTNWVAESGATVRTSLGLGTGDSPQFTAIELGNASDTTITRASAGVIAVEGSNLLRAADLGVSVQAYDADTAKTDVAQTFTAQQTLTAGAVLQSVTAASIAAIGDAINTTNKAKAKVVFDETNNRIMVASGAAAGDAWYVADGSASVTPA